MSSWRRLPHPAWLLLISIVLAVSGIGYSLWRDYDRVQRFREEMGKYVNVVEARSRAPEWLTNDEARMSKEAQNPKLEARNGI